MGTVRLITYLVVVLASVWETTAICYTSESHCSAVLEEVLNERDLTFERRDGNHLVYIQPNHRTRIRDGDRFFIRHHINSERTETQPFEFFCFQLRVRNVKTVIMKVEVYDGVDQDFEFTPNSRNWETVSLTAAHRLIHVERIKVYFKRKESGRTMYVKNWDFSGCTGQFADLD